MALILLIIFWAYQNIPILNGEQQLFHQVNPHPATSLNRFLCVCISYWVALAIAVRMYINFILPIELFSFTLFWPYMLYTQINNIQVQIRV